MKTQLIALPIIAALLTGCGSQKTTYIETGGTDSVVSAGQVDIQDIQNAASGMIESLLSNGVLDRAAHYPARLVIDRVVNDTSSRFDTGELLYRIREQLVNSGQVEVITAYGDNAESQISQEELRRKAFLEGKSADDALTPDMALTGKITQLYRTAGKTRQTTYTFRLTLTDVGTGRSVWSKTVDMTKQGKKDAVGF